MMSMRVIGAMAVLLALGGCGGEADPVANSEVAGAPAPGEPAANMALAAPAVASTPTATHSATTAAMPDGCGGFGTQEQALQGVFTWGQPLAEAVRRLKCRGFAVSDMPLREIRMKPWGQPGEIRAVRDSVRVFLTYAGVPDQERVIRIRQTVSLPKRQPVSMRVPIDGLEKHYGRFTPVPGMRANEHAGMIARDVDAGAAGADGGWPELCFKARQRSVSDAPACGETLVYEVRTYPGGDMVERFAFTVDNYREAGKALAEAQRAVAALAEREAQERNAVVGADGLTREASEVAANCDMNVYMKQYFKCGCIARAFQKVRERLGPGAPAWKISETITNSADVDPACANTDVIRTRAIRSCGGFVAGYESAPRDIKTNKQRYCQCVGDRMSGAFAKAPRLASGYIEGLRSSAMTTCRSAGGR